MAEHRGLTAEEVSARIASGRVNTVPQRGGRSALDIVRANVFTWFNLTLGALFLLMILFASWRDALFGLLLVANTAIGIVQELRAKSTLDRLSLLSAPKVRVIRDGDVVEIASAEVVLDDLIVLTVGDQLVVDATIVDTSGVEIDESALTGESVPAAKSAGEPVLSGSFVVAGQALGRATAVGSEAYARRIESEGRRYTRVSSDIMDSINRILQVVGVLMVPIGVLTIWRQATSGAELSVKVTNAVAPLVAMVPEGLVLLSSIAFAVAAVRLARQQVLVNELPSVEGLARTDVLCADKTGTLTEPQPALTGLDVLAEAAMDEQMVRAALGALVWTDPAPNPSMDALRRALPAPDGWSARSTVPFSSGRKWSGADFAGRGAWVLGAPDVVLAHLPAASAERSHAAELSNQGNRVLVLAAASEPLSRDRLPESLKAAALISLSEEVRSDAAETIRYLQNQGIEIKIVSGDDPRTAQRIASRAGVPNAERALDATLLSDAEAIAGAMQKTTVFGRVMPEQKRAMVSALQQAGHVVAMTGDGVNDVLAVKQADLGIAMGSGVAATKAVAQLVLLDSRFAHMPLIVGEGRRVTANAERVANLFLTKTCWALLISIVVLVLALPYPFLPRQLTLVGSLTIGIPAFFLALAPNDRRYERGLLGRVLAFAAPAGTASALAVTAVYLGALSSALPLETARTLSTLTLACVGLGVIVVLEWPLRGWRLGIVAIMSASIGVAFTLPLARDFFAFVLPSATAVWTSVIVSAVAIASIALVHRRGRASRS